jgi:aminopeptidase N
MCTKRLVPLVMLTAATLLLLVPPSLLAASGPRWSPDHPRDKLIGGEPLLDVRDPSANYRSLGIAPAAARGVFDGCPHDFDVLHYELNFSEVDIDAFNLAGNTVITLRSEVDGLTSIELDFKPNLTVSSVLQESVTPLTFSHVDDVLTIELAAPADSGETLSVDIAYAGTPWNEGGGGFGGFWMGPYPRNAFSMGVGLYTDPPSMGRTWFPCYDRPCDKATADVNVTLGLTDMAVANGLLTAVDTTGAEHTFHWSHDYPISTYLIAISVAPYKVMPDSDDARITYYHHPGLKKKSQVSFQFVDLMMECYETRYGTYPFDKFAYMTTQKGDMEHQTCVSHQYSLVDSTNTYDDILSHEMSHMWYGDCVTYGDWRDVWLSEGFATYSEAVYREYKNGTADYHNYVTTFLINRVINSGIPDGVYNPTYLWGVIAYEKGACVLHMLRGVLDNDALFWQVLRDYRANHAYDNAVTTDFLADVNATVGQDMTWFFDPWVYGLGHPIYEYGWSYDAIGGGQYQVDVVIRQTQTTGTLFDLPVDFRVETTGGDFDFSERIAAAEETVSFVVPAEPTGFLVDPEDWILNEQMLAPTSIDYTEEVAAAQALALHAPQPNPVVERTRIRFYLPRAARVDLGVYDVTGRRVRTLVSGAEEAGSRAVFWDRRAQNGGKVAPGAYFVRLVTEGRTLSERMIVLD